MGSLAFWLHLSSASGVDCNVVARMALRILCRSWFLILDLGVAGDDRIPYSIRSINRYARSRLLPSSGVGFIKYAESGANMYIQNFRIKGQLALSLPVFTGLIAGLLFIVPAHAQNAVNQDAASNTGSQNAASSAQVQTGTSATNTELAKFNTQYATGQAPLQQQSREGFWGHVNPMARKGWVNRQVVPIKDRLQELKQLSAANAQQIKDQDARTQAGLQRVSVAAQQADAHASEAAAAAAQAQDLAQRSDEHTDQMGTAVAGMDLYQTSSQVEIRFPSGQNILGQNARAALDQVASQVQGQKGYLIDVQGYSSLHGVAGIQASHRMVAAVTRYLIEKHEVPLYRVRQISLGNTPVGDAGNAKAATHYHGSIVEVNVLHNSLSALSASNAGGSPMDAAQSGPAQSSSNGIASQPTQDQ